MQILTKLRSIVPAACLSLLLTACGDVGDAPQARTGEAVDVADSGEGRRLSIDTTRSTVEWRAAKVTRAHEGGFRSFSGTVTATGSEVTGVELNIDTRSIWSDTERLTGHLRSEDFFAVDSFPTATFVANRFVPTDSAGATHLVTGNLTMHGQTNGITFPATIAVQPGLVQAQGDFIIDRRRWGITYTGMADDLIENEVRILLDVVATDDQPVTGLPQDSVRAVD